MDVGSFSAGIVLGAAAAGLIAWLWMRSRVTIAESKAAAAEAMTQQASATFQAMADAALRSNQGAFLQAAQSALDTLHARLAGDLAVRQTALEGVVKPLSESVDKLDRQVRKVEADRAAMFGGLEQQLKLLSQETGALSSALKAPQTRGRWGEITLRRVVELAGMSSYCDFVEQDTRDRIRPDMTIRLPGGRTIVIDAKVPLSAYLDACSAANEAQRRSALERHATQIERHADQLAGKQYWAQFQPAPELVVLFLPGDHFFAAALETQPDLLERAVERRVLIATPVTLISVLKGIAFGWSQQQLAENAIQIRTAAVEFIDRLGIFATHYAEAGQGLQRALESYNRSVGSWESRLAPSLKKIRDLGLTTGAAELTLEPVDLQARAPRTTAAGDLFK